MGAAGVWTHWVPVANVFCLFSIRCCISQWQRRSMYYIEKVYNVNYYYGQTSDTCTLMSQTPMGPVFSQG